MEKLAALQRSELQAQLEQAKNEIRSDTNRALQICVECLQFAGSCMIKKISKKEKAYLFFTTTTTKAIKFGEKCFVEN